MSSARKSIGRAVWLGLSGGLFFGGLMLLAFGARGIFFPPPCSAPVDSAECALHRDLIASLARRQALFGGLLALLALSVFSFFRSRFQRPDEHPSA